MFFLKRLKNKGKKNSLKIEAVFHNSGFVGG